MIQFENVSKVFPSPDGPVRALDGVTLQIAEGQFAAVRGKSGCGKSTLLHLAGAMALPTAGRVIVAGKDLQNLSPIERTRFRGQTIGFVFQMFHLLPYLNVLDNVLLAALPGQEATARKRGGDLLEKFGLAHRLKHRPDQLSVGERQRAAIARALVNGPKALLADEPTGNLDGESTAAVLAILSEFHRGGGTVLLATHDEAVATAANRALELRDGRLVT
ncbi:MAG: ABC transporter ATP-binding protein [Planctomycetia bacterium]|nr:ABC transporter ATP-binding protein [Planctomycetia bacterium]